ncbi:actin-binding Rho-activating protein [Platysternon megacephalum]|uniref:Actin-binding Rho-activating protein n=1 Tax=Platysternon megacephalum TaxID=55544 RepID=A0A4D9DKA6_9SAUR|nr:actin-binding Rho-activating protein [Platysternon megacephalum]
MGVIGHHKENPDLYLPQIGQEVMEMSWGRGLSVILGEGGCLLPPQCPAGTKKAQLLSQQGSAMATTVTAGSAGPITIINRFITQPHTASAAIPAKLQPLEKFHKGEPLALGITQILFGAVQFAVGVVMAMVNSYLWILALSVHVPIWSGLLYIISGALSVAAAKNPKIQLVKGSLGMNIISSVLAGCAMILYLVSLLESRHQYRCNWYPEECITYKVTVACITVLFLFTFLEFCVSISTAAFGCKAVCRNSYSEVSVVIYQNMMTPDDPATATNTRTDAVACTPPPYKDLATP